MEFKKYTVEELVKLNMIEKPMDGNHGNKHPKGSDYIKKGIPFIMASDIDNGKINYKTCKYISVEQRNKLDKGFAKANDVLLSHKATIGLTCIVDDKFDEIVITPQLTYYRVKKGINNYYLKYYFDSLYFQNILKNWATSGSTRAYLGITAQLELPILLPKIENQEKIAKILSLIDNKIELNNHINDNLYKILIALYKEKLTRRNTEIKTLDEFCDIFTGRKNANESDKNGVNNFFTCGDKVLKINSYIYDGPAVIISGNGSYTGRTLFYNGKFDLYQRTYACTVKENINKNYIYGLYPIIKNELSKKIKGGTHGSAIPYIVMNDLAKFNVNYNEEIFKEFSNEAKIILNKMQENDEQNIVLEKIRDTLLPKLMNGEINLDKVEI